MSVAGIAVGGIHLRLLWSRAVSARQVVEPALSLKELDRGFNLLKDPWSPVSLAGLVALDLGRTAYATCSRCPGREPSGTSARRAIPSKD